jgi:hypothetical protein
MKKKFTYLSILPIIPFLKIKKSTTTNNHNIKKWLEKNLNSIPDNSTQKEIENLVDNTIGNVEIASFLLEDAWLNSLERTKLDYINTLKKHFALNITYFLQHYPYKNYTIKTIRSNQTITRVTIDFENNLMIMPWIIKKKGRFYIIDIIVKDRSFILRKKTKFIELLESLDNNLEKFNSKLDELNTKASALLYTNYDKTSTNYNRSSKKPYPFETLRHLLLL